MLPSDLTTVYTHTRNISIHVTKVRKDGWMEGGGEIVALMMALYRVKKKKMGSQSEWMA